MINSSDSQSRLQDDRPQRIDVPATVALPYSHANMVFIEAGPFWLLIIVGVLGTLVAGLGLVAGADTGGLLIPAGICAVVGVGGLLIFRNVLWRWALHGRQWAIVVLYVSFAFGIVFIPLLGIPMAAFVLLPLVMPLADATGSGGWVIVVLIGLVVVVVLGLVWLLALMNLFERALWPFAQLDGLCPVCRQWRFGPIRRIGTMHCAKCAAVIEFIRADDQEDSSDAAVYADVLDNGHTEKPTADKTGLLRQQEKCRSGASTPYAAVSHLSPRLTSPGRRPGATASEKKSRWWVRLDMGHIRTGPVGISRR